MTAHVLPNPIVSHPGPPKHYVMAHQQPPPPQHIVYDAAGMPYVPYVAPQMVRCYPVVVNQVAQPSYRSAGEPRQIARPQGYSSAGEPGRYAHVAMPMVAPSGNSFGRSPYPPQARVLAELPPGDVRSTLSRGGATAPQHGGVVGVATMVAAVPHAARSGRLQPVSHQAGGHYPPRPVAYASDPNLGPRVVLGSRRSAGHSASARIVLHDSFATVSDVPDGHPSHTTVHSSGGSFTPPQSDNRPTVAAANPYAGSGPRRVANPFAAHAVGVPARLNSSMSINSSQTSAHALEPAGTLDPIRFVDRLHQLTTQVQVRSRSPRPPPKQQPQWSTCCVLPPASPHGVTRQRSWAPPSLRASSSRPTSARPRVTSAFGLGTVRAATLMWWNSSCRRRLNRPR